MVGDPQTVEDADFTERVSGTAVGTVLTPSKFGDESYDSFVFLEFPDALHGEGLLGGLCQDQLSAMRQRRTASLLSLARGSCSLRRPRTTDQAQ